MNGWKRVSAPAAAVVCLAAAGCGGDGEPATSTVAAATTAATTGEATTATSANETLIQVVYADGTITGGGRREAQGGRR